MPSQNFLFYNQTDITEVSNFVEKSSAKLRKQRDIAIIVHSSMDLMYIYISNCNVHNFMDFTQLTVKLPKVTLNNRTVQEITQIDVGYVQ